jgi:tryptophan synthase alpha chain
MIKSVRQTILEKGKDVLNVYFTAGFPTLDSVGSIICELDRCGVDLIELGIPYSDPLADGEIIQESSTHALTNGQTIKNIFNQIRSVREESSVPLILMGYYNAFLQFGEEKFLKEASESGVQGLILPDLPMDVYEDHYKSLFENYSMEISFLITPHTSEERILQADRLSSGFIYVVSQSSITGGAKDISEQQEVYFKRIDSMGLQSPRLIGFGIHDGKSRKAASAYAQGVITGSAFIKALKGQGSLKDNISGFIRSLSDEAG